MSIAVYNEHGGLVIRQSDLNSYARCAQQMKLERTAEASGGKGRSNLSATVYGTVMHHAVQVMEKLHHEGREDAADVAVATFVHYWMPENITELEPGGIDEWLPRETYGGLRERGIYVLRSYYDLLRKDTANGNQKLLALEQPFRVPVEIDGRMHTLSGTIDRLALRLSNRKPYLCVEDFKGLDVTTPLPTPTGWTTMGAVQVGDQLLGADGKPCTVTAKSGLHDRPCYRVAFDDGTSLIADNVHLWQVETNAGTRVLSTEDLRRELVDPATGQRHLRIPNAEALDLPAAKLPVDPYVLGVWLGDGHATSGEVSKPDPDLFVELARRGYDPGPAWDGMTRTLKGLRTQLRKAGLLGNKHVPDVYLRASVAQRLDLLRGLMDTDGCWHRTRRRAVFTGCDKALCEAVYELVASLGWRPSIFEVTRKGFGKSVTAWDVTFAPLDANPFLLPRKRDLVDVSPKTRGHRRLVVSVEPTVSVPTQCVQVDSADSLYLAGRQMVPTHNTGRKPTYLRYSVQWTVYCYATTQPEFWAAWPADYLESLERPLAKKGLNLLELPRKGRWINLRDPKVVDAGWRGPQDYARMKVALAEYVRAVEGDVFPLTLSGATCMYCPFARNGMCGGVPIPDEDEGAPA